MSQRIRFYTQADSIDLFYISFIAGSSIDAEGVKALDIYLSAIQAEQVTTGWFVIGQQRYQYREAEVFNFNQIHPAEEKVCGNLNLLEMG
jgi:hypothetical protein